MSKELNDNQIKALKLIKQYNSNSFFLSSDYSREEEKYIASSTLNSLVNRGYLKKYKPLNWSNIYYLPTLFFPEEELQKYADSMSANNTQKIIDEVKKYYDMDQKDYDIINKKYFNLELNKKILITLTQYTLPKLKKELKRKLFFKTNINKLSYLFKNIRMVYSGIIRYNCASNDSDIDYVQAYLALKYYSLISYINLFNIDKRYNSCELKRYEEDLKSYLSDSNHMFKNHNSFNLLLNNDLLNYSEIIELSIYPISLFRQDLDDIYKNIRCCTFGASFLQEEAGEINFDW